MIRKQEALCSRLRADLVFAADAMENGVEQAKTDYRMILEAMLEAEAELKRLKGIPLREAELKLLNKARRLNI